MDDNFNRLESAVTATSCGNLTWEQWPHDVATALGLAGRRNPLGFAVVRYLSEEPTSGNVWRVIIQLASELVKQGHDAAQANDAAWKAMDIWNNTRCTTCNGRGVMNAQQHVCPACKGTGKRGEAMHSAIVRDAISELNEAERWMDGQLSARLRGAVYRSDSSDGYRLNLGAQVGNNVGSGGMAATPKAAGHD